MFQPFWNSVEIAVDLTIPEDNGSEFSDQKVHNITFLHTA
jgi:hypothetical protein